MIPRCSSCIKRTSKYII